MRVHDLVLNDIPSIKVVILEHLNLQMEEYLLMSWYLSLDLEWSCTTRENGHIYGWYHHLCFGIVYVFFVCYNVFITFVTLISAHSACCSYFVPLLPETSLIAFKFVYFYNVILRCLKQIDV
jgi:hypothetical protein